MHPKSQIRLITIRMTPDQDVRQELIALANKENLKAASIIAAVGSLKQVNLRYAQSKSPTQVVGPYEILSLSGHLSTGGLHAHLSVGDAKGAVIGGHLMEGNLIRTTLEVTLLENEALEFLRFDDPVTGYKELEVRPRVSSEHL